MMPVNSPAHGGKSNEAKMMSPEQLFQNIHDANSNGRNNFCHSAFDSKEHLDGGQDARVCVSYFGDEDKELYDGC